MLTTVQAPTARIDSSSQAFPLRRMVVILDFPLHQNAGMTAAELVPDGFDFEILAGPLAGDVGQAIGRTETQDWEACVRRAAVDHDADIVLILRDSAMNRGEVEFALDTLATSDSAMHFTIPGLSELQTSDHVALFAVDTRRMAALPRPPVGERMRRWAAPRIPLNIKQPLRDALVKLGVSGHFGILPAAKEQQPGSEPIRISNTNSVASVLRTENPMNRPCTFSLGTRATQQLLFVDRVQDIRPYPRAINIVLSNQCNLACVMCPFHSPLFLEARTTDYFDAKKWVGVDMIRKLVDDVRAIKPDQDPITFHMGELDEPALHPNLVKIVEMLRSIPNSTVHITSNGNIFSEKLARGLINAGLQSIQFSVDAQTAETYKKIRGGKLSKVQSNVKRFLDLRRELGKDVYVNICIIDQEGATGEIEDFKVYWRKAGASSVSVYRLFKPDNENSAKWVVPSKNFEEKARTPCTAAWDQCFVFPDGEISLCCTTLLRVPQDGIISKGDIKQESLKDVWLGEPYQKLRRDLINNDLKDHKYCADCDNWSSSYQYQKVETDGTKIVYGESMAYHFYPENQ